MHRSIAIPVVLALVTGMTAVLSCAAQLSHDQQTHSAAPVLTLTSKDRAKTVQLHVGQMLEVQLAANPSTGYSWTLNGSAVPLELVKSDFMPHAGKSGKVGAAGAQSLRFVAKSDGTVKLVLDYHRPWEKNKRPARTFSVTVNVVP